MGFTIQSRLINKANYCSKPTPEEDSTINITWKPATSQKMEYLYIGTGGKVNMAEGLFSERAAFWRSLSKSTMAKDEL